MPPPDTKKVGPRRHNGKPTTSSVPTSTITTVRVADDIPTVTTGRALMGRTKGHELAHTGTFPCRVLQFDGSYVVVKAGRLRLLGLRQDTQPTEQPAVAS